MKVNELIKKLSEVDSELEVFFWDGDKSYEIDRFATEDDEYGEEEVILYNEALRVIAYDS